MKVMTILGTRPEIIRLSRVIARLDDAAELDHVLVHTGQNYDYELNEIFFADLGVRKPDVFLDISRESLGRAYGDILVGSEQALLEHRPDALLVLGDTNSALSAVMAKRMHVPVFHMEAGNRSFDPNVPEEVNRRIVDHLADFNLVYTEHARRNLLAEGVEPRRIYLSGSPMKEVLRHQQASIEASDALDRLGLVAGGYFLVSTHREENVDVPSRLLTLIETLNALTRRYDKQVVVSLHPRTRARVEGHAGRLSERVILHAPFGYSDYCRLQLDAACVLSDSGTIAEEASLLGFPAVTIRDSMERPEGLDTGSIVLCGLEANDVLAAVAEVMVVDDSQPAIPDGYAVGDCSRRTLRLLLGLTGRSEQWSGLHDRRASE